MYASTSIKSVLLIALASVFATGVELAGIDSLAAPRAKVERHVAVVQLPTVVVTAQREAEAVVKVRHLPTVVITAQREVAAAAEIKQLPRIVITGHRETRTAQSEQRAAAI